MGWIWRWGSGGWLCLDEVMKVGILPHKVNKDQDFLQLPHEGIVNGGRLRARNKALTRKQISQQPDLDLSGSRTVRNECVLFKPPRSMVLFMAAYAY